MDMNPISALPHPAATPAAPEDPKLRYACREIEGFFLSILLKEGMKSVVDGSEGDEASRIYGPLTEYALEQAGRDLSHQQSMGLADILYEQLSP